LTANATSARYWEIDTLRGFAIVEMVLYHLTWDLVYFGLYQANMLTGPWQSFARSIATIFIFVMGLSMTLSYHRAVHRAGHRRLWAKFLRRGGQIFGLGLIVTVATYFFLGRGFVIFGILHAIGLSIIAAYPFLDRGKWLSLGAGLAAIGLGLYLNSLVVSYPWLVPLGVKQAGRYMVDYYPFFPWFGVALLGVFAGKALYPAGVRRFTLPDWSDAAIVRGLRFLGRHSLLIYVTHQPILIGLFILLGFGSF
jgi:uncharacterized membrane protein